MVLHDQDYDAERATNFLFDGGEINLDWKLAGNKGSSKTKPTSPNQTLDTDDPSHHHQPPRTNNYKSKQQSHKGQNNNTYKNRPRDRQRYNNNYENNKQHSGHEEFPTDGQNFEKKFSNLDVQDQELNQHQHDENNEYSSRNNFNNRRGMNNANGARSSGRGGRGGSYRGGLAARGTGRRWDDTQNRRGQSSEFVNTNNPDEVINVPETNENVKQVEDQVEAQVEVEQDVAKKRVMTI